jgi:hypothetical protein
MHLQFNECKRSSCILRCHLANNWNGGSAVDCCEESEDASASRWRLAGRQHLSPHIGNAITYENQSSYN